MVADEIRAGMARYDVERSRLGVYLPRVQVYDRSWICDVIAVGPFEVRCWSSPQSGLPTATPGRRPGASTLSSLFLSAYPTSP